LGGKVKSGNKVFPEKRRKSKVDEARDILANVVLCHVPVLKYNFQGKVGWPVTITYRDMWLHNIST
jgi:DNA-directed RNA polymerase III subunit RPC2